MPGVQPKSVNEAYRKISERYEPSRRSAGGNVFLSVYIKPSDDSPLVALSTLRDDRTKTWDAYVRTVFTATIDGEHVEIRPGYHSEILDKLLRARRASEWAYVTAYNPQSRLLPEERNRARHHELCTVVQGLGLTFFEGHAGGPDGDWPVEVSLIVLGIGLEDARRLGRQFDQLAIVTGGIAEPSRLVPC